MKVSIVLNSHSLSNFSRCPRLYWYSDVMYYRLNRAKAALSKGTLFTRMLALYYKERQRHGSVTQEFVQKIAKAAYGPTIKEETKSFLSLRFINYAAYFRNEDIRVLAVEKGFAFVLYEDKDYQFIYEGTPDLVASVDGHLSVFDHKTRSQDRDINEFTNQALGYCYGVGTDQFIYNYIGLQTTGNASHWFKRQPVRFSTYQLKEWRENTLYSFYRVAEILKAQKFPRTYACDGKYGSCFFKYPCAQPDKRSELIVLNGDYNTNGRRSSW
jgi:PD-(D/E)XK nuclease superfamily